MADTMVSTFWANKRRKPDLRRRLHLRLMPGTIATMKDTMEDIMDTPICTMDKVTITGGRRVTVF